MRRTPRPLYRPVLPRRVVPRIPSPVEVVPQPSQPLRIRRRVRETEPRPTIKERRQRVKPQKKTEREVTRLVEPRVPYISDLAMPYTRAFADRTRQNPGQVLNTLQSNLHRARKAHSKVAEIRTLSEIGHVYYLTGRLPQAVETYEKVLGQARKSGARQWEVVSLLSLGAVNTAKGKYDTAYLMNAEALSTARAAGAMRETQMILNNLGVLEKYRGEYEKALMMYQEAMETDARSSRERVLILKNTARFYRHWGETEDAIGHYEQSVEVAQNLGDLREEGEALMELAEGHLQMTGDTQQALESAGKAFDALKRARVSTAPAMKLMGDLYMDIGALTRAEPYLKKAGYGSSLGRYFLLRSDPLKARKHFQDVLTAAREDENLDELFAAYTGLAQVAENSKDYRQAERYYSEALEVTEKIRDGLIPSDRKNFYAVSVNGFVRSEPAKGLIRVALKRDRPEQSIYPSETVRARAFADNLAHKADAGSFGVRRDVLEQEAAIANQLASVVMARGILPNDMDRQRFSELSSQIRNLRAQQQAFIQKLRKTYPDYAEVKYPRPLKLSEVSFRPDEYVLVLDVVGEGVAVRLLHRKKVLKAYVSIWEPGGLEKDVREFRRPFEQVRLRDFNVDLAHKLYRKLLADPLELVPRGSSVTILADGLLALLPFEAFIQSGNFQWAENDIGPYLQGVTYVGDLYRVFYGQSLTAISLTRKLARRTPTGDRMLVMADPVFEMNDPRARALGPQTEVASREKDRSARVNAILGRRGGNLLRMPRLRATRELARNLKNTFGPICEVYSGLKSTKRELLDNLSRKPDRYQSIIMATHGFVANGVPGFMEPVMAFTMVPPGTDGLLTMSEVAGMKLSADVAALTACQTGVGMRLAGEGIISMGRAFQVAGVKSVIMSLWSVAEEPSVRLMEEFFKAYGRGKTKLEAWAEARTKIREAGFEHPFFWAGFIFVGEPAR